MDELHIKSSTWTRESHGLYDFEGKDVQCKSFKVKGSQFIFRKDSEVDVAMVSNYSKMRFQEDEESMAAEKRDNIIGRILIKDGKYWLFHRHLIDEGLQEVLEKKPEEKAWRVVKEVFNEIPELETPSIKLNKGDLIKVGRVRFKIRDIMSPIYEKIEDENDRKRDLFDMRYPSFHDNSINLHAYSSMEDSYDEEDSSEEPNEATSQVAPANANSPNNGEGDVLAEAEAILGVDTDSEADPIGQQAQSRNNNDMTVNPIIGRGHNRRDTAALFH